MRTPAFIIGGAPRSGTTWLVHVLEKHPNIFLATPYVPEPKFFLVDKEYAKGLGYYLDRWFSDVQPGQVAGEKTTNYLEDSRVAPRIQEHLPHVKLVFILREPVDRAYNNYLWSKGNGLETMGFEEALERESERLAAMPEKWRYTKPFDYFHRGLYAKHLTHYFRLFPKEQILCLKYEDIVTKPDQLVARLHHFLEVVGRPLDVDQLGVVNAAQDEALADDRLDPVLLSRLRELYSQPNQELAELLPDFDVW